MVSFATIVSDVGVVAGLFAGPVIKLGDFTFKDFEIPEHVTFGGKQAVVLHKFPGGARIIDAMGRDDKDITFGGILLSYNGSNPVARAQQLDQIRIAGLPVVLSWGSFRYTVIVTDIDFDYKYSNQIHYVITCMPTQVALPGSTAQGLFGSILNDIGNAIGVNIPAALATVNSAISEVTPYVSALGTLTGGSPAALSILSGVNQAQSITSQFSGIANVGLSGYSSGSSPFSSLNPTGAVSTLSSLGDMVKNASATANIMPFLDRMASNLRNPAAS